MKFTKPELELIRFSIMDVIQTSITPKPGQEKEETSGYIYTEKQTDDPFGGGGEI